MSKAKSSFYTLRDGIGTADWPTETNAYNPASEPAQRLVSRMLSYGESALSYVDAHAKMYDVVQFRFSLAAAALAGTDQVTVHFMAAKRDDTSVYHVGEATLTAGAQTNSGGRHFVDNISLSSNWLGDVDVENVGDGIAQMELHLHSFDRVWVAIANLDANGNGNDRDLTVEYSGYEKN